MAEDTKIEWCDHTASPWYGCKEVHAVRFKSESFIRNLEKWNRQGEQEGQVHSVFPSLCDPFEDFPGLDACRREMFEAADRLPWIRLLLLTKRPENIRRMWPAVVRPQEDVVESRVPVVGFPGYEVSNLGVVYHCGGSTKCCNCGVDISADEGLARKKYCSGACRQAASRRARTGGPRDTYAPTSRPLSPSVSDSGHHTVHLPRDGVKHPILVHRLVLATFDRPSKEGEQGRHLDGNPGNNKINNLAWGTQSENWNDSKGHGTHRRYSKLSEDQVDQIRVLHQEGDTYSSLAIRFQVSATQIRNICSGRQWQSYETPEYRSNCWLLTSVSDQATADRMIPELLKCRDLSPVLGISAEPLLGAIDLREFVGYGRYNGNIPGRCVNIDGESIHAEGRKCRQCGWGFPDDPDYPRRVAGLDWVIVGGESGHNARPMHPDWPRSLRDQCQAAAVPFFFKQWGEWAPEIEYGPTPIAAGSLHKWTVAASTDRMSIGNVRWRAHSADGNCYMLDKVGKKAAGRLLDDREWHEFPRVELPITGKKR